MHFFQGLHAGCGAKEVIQPDDDKVMIRRIRLRIE